MKPVLFVKVPTSLSSSETRHNVEYTLNKRKFSQNYEIVVVPETFEFEVLDKDGLTNIVKAVNISSKELQEMLDNDNQT